MKLRVSQQGGKCLDRLSDRQRLYVLQGVFFKSNITLFNNMLIVNFSLHTLQHININLQAPEHLHTPKEASRWKTETNSML